MKSFYIGKKELARKLNSSPSSVTRWSKDIPEFPKPFLIGPNKVVWDLREVLRYINNQKKLRGFLGHKPKKKK
ncbi:MAG: AlpA family phage regulatory protein [Proteobacteria bacterium]|jgi:predicted DNA-binding transcriptional regulator AlpA|nr:AlpA family phage regulatory protein [Pseudomonadota bacterium]